MTSYVRNVATEAYKVGMSTAPNSAVPGTPRTHGLIVAAHFWVKSVLPNASGTLHLTRTRNTQTIKLTSNRAVLSQSTALLGAPLIYGRSTI